MRHDLAVGVHLPQDDAASDSEAPAPSLLLQPCLPEKTPGWVGVNVALARGQLGCRHESLTVTMSPFPWLIGKGARFGGLWTTKSLCPARSQHQRWREMLSPRFGHSGHSEWSLSSHRGCLPTRRGWRVWKSRRDHRKVAPALQGDWRRGHLCKVNRGLRGGHGSTPMAKAGAQPADGHHGHLGLEHATRSSAPPVSFLVLGHTPPLLKRAPLPS